MCSGLVNAGKAVWVSGEVTKVPYEKNGTYYIQVEGTTYRILPEISLEYRYEAKPGVFYERKAFISMISLNQKIQIKVADYNIHQLIIY